MNPRQKRTPQELKVSHSHCFVDSNDVSRTIDFCYLGILSQKWCLQVFDRVVAVPGQGEQNSSDPVTDWTCELLGMIVRSARYSAVLW